MGNIRDYLDKKIEPRKMSDNDRAIARHYSQAFLADSPFTGDYAGTAIAVRDSLAVSKYDPNATPAIAKVNKNKKTEKDYIQAYINAKGTYQFNPDSVSADQASDYKFKNRMIVKTNEELKAKAEKQFKEKYPVPLEEILEKINKDAKAYVKFLQETGVRSAAEIQHAAKVFMSQSMEKEGLDPAGYIRLDEPDRPNTPHVESEDEDLEDVKIIPQSVMQPIKIDEPSPVPVKKREQEYAKETLAMKVANPPPESKKIGKKLEAKYQELTNKYKNNRYIEVKKTYNNNANRWELKLKTDVEGELKRQLGIYILPGGEKIDISHIKEDSNRNPDEKEALYQSKIVKYVGEYIQNDLNNPGK